MERMTKIGMYGVALIMLAACGKGIPGTMMQPARLKPRK